jgi:hypothetical protein
MSVSTSLIDTPSAGVIAANALLFTIWKRERFSRMDVYQHESSLGIDAGKSRAEEQIKHSS